MAPGVTGVMVRQNFSKVQRVEGPSSFLEWKTPSWMEFLLSLKAGDKHLGKKLPAMSQLIQQGPSPETWPALPTTELVFG